MTSPRTLYEKLFAAHVVVEQGPQPLLYIDRHLLHEVTSPQAFAGLKQQGRSVRQPGKTFATMDHNVSTQSMALEACSPMAKIQLQALTDNCQQFAIPLYGIGDERQGIVHVMGPEQGLTLPGMTVVCGDSHTSTHGAFGALAFGIGTSEVEHVLATQTLPQARAKAMRITIDGQLVQGVYAKDIALAIVNTVGHAGATGHVIEFAGSTVSQLSMEGRMTLCNMAIEMGAKAGLIAPDATTFSYLAGRPFAPKGEQWQQALSYWQQLYSDENATFDCEYALSIDTLLPQITWGTHPDQVIDISQTIPDPANFADEQQRQAATRALQYMGLTPGIAWQAIKLDRIFIGSCTNSRIEDLRVAAHIVKGHSIAPHLQAIVVPGSMQVRKQAQEEGLDQIFINAGFEWRLPGCSMCLAMNDDRLAPQQRCASTSNRNFEGRQGRGGRTHLVSPAMAAAAAINGYFTDCRDFL